MFKGENLDITGGKKTPQTQNLSHEQSKKPHLFTHKKSERQMIIYRGEISIVFFMAF